MFKINKDKRNLSERFGYLTWRNNELIKEFNASLPTKIEVNKTY